MNYVHVRDILLTLEAGEVLRWVKFKGYSKIRSVESFILQLIAGVQNAYLSAPAMVYEVYPVTEMTSSQVSVLQKSG